MDNFLYVSDSRGGWMRKNLPAILDAGTELRLMVLTHPFRWTPVPEKSEALLPRCLNGRNDYVLWVISATMRLWSNVHGRRERDKEIWSNDFP